ncbi:MAG TPA: hypothetical protein VL486_14310 [Verrucomicrobiae bacterium]|nr:hypothetical protein [Verrucomicrobiae bacterium]
MNAIDRICQNRGGSVLLAVLGFLFLAMGLVETILYLSSTHRKIAQRQVNMEQAMFVAEAGLERGSRFIESNIVVLGASSGFTNGSGSVGSGSYYYQISRPNSTTYSIVSTGTVNGVSRTVSLLRIYQPTYAEFALWSQTNGVIWFKHGEVFNGRVHADDEMYFDVTGGGPVFQATVTSGAGTYTVNGGTISGVEFDQGFFLNTFEGSMADVDFNSSSSTSLKNAATSSGLVLQGNTTITFNGSSVKITNSRAGWSNHTYTPPTEGIVYIQNSNSGTTSTRAGTAYLTGGSVNGRLTVVTESDIYVQGNITYASDPQVNPSSDDALGLISQDDVWVDTSAPDNLTIDAAIMATGQSSPSDNGSFGVINYDDSSYPHLGNRGTLTVYGGIVQQVRGAVGTFNSHTGQTSTGYAKNYSYDPRFINDPPPYYPVISSEVRFSQWQEGPR